MYGYSSQKYMNQHPEWASPKRMQTRTPQERGKAFDEWYVRTSTTREIPASARILTCVR